MKLNKPIWIIDHHSGGTDDNPLADTSHHTVAIVNEWHRIKGNKKSSLGFYVGYHYVIEWSGKITQTRALNEEGAHTPGMNRKSVGILTMGNFDRPLLWDNSVPNARQITSRKKLADELAEYQNIDKRKIAGHRIFAPWKTCPGRNIPDDWGRKLYDEVLTTKIGLYNQLIILYTKILNVFLKRS